MVGVRLKGKEEKSKINSLIFPFGCNNSQFKAVSTALNNQVSIIQGPPGTGKTQTILNIIANLFMHDKTVLIFQYPTKPRVFRVPPRVRRVLF